MKNTESQELALHQGFIRQRGSATQGVPPGKEALNWVANTATLIWGERDAVLVDTFLGDAQTTELADWIEKRTERCGPFIRTHGHPDHFFGLEFSAAAPAGARRSAAQRRAGNARAAAAPEVVANNWSRRWPGQILEHLAIARERWRQSHRTRRLHGIRVIDTGHTDTDDTTALHIPSLGLLIAGDAVYNETHPFLVESDQAGRQGWLAAIDRIAAIDPQVVVVGHGPLEPDCSSPPHRRDAPIYR